MQDKLEKILCQIGFAEENYDCFFNGILEKHKYLNCTLFQ